MLTTRPRPRWLVEHGKTEQALETLQFYREGYYSADETELELSEIERSVAVFRISGVTWTSLFTDGGLFARMWRAALLQFMSQMCGAAAMKYYLSILLRALGFSRRASLLVGGIETTLKIACTVAEMLIIDKVGRRVTLVAASTVMAIALMVRTRHCYEGYPSWAMPCLVSWMLTRHVRSSVSSATSVTSPTTFVSSSSSSTRSVIAWALDLPLGCMAPR
jgi:hypothetical protein